MKLWPFSRKSGASVRDSLELFRELFGGRLSKAGVQVDWKTAMEVTTVLACARVIAEGVAQVPFKLFRDDAAGKQVATDHPLFLRLYRKPNPWQTSYEWRETMALHAVLARAHYSFINRGIGGRVLELVPIEPQLVTTKCAADGTLSYDVTGRNGQTINYPAEAILHVKGPSWNGWEGLDVVHQAREAIGLAIATENAHARLHRNGVMPSGTWSVDGKLNPTQYKDLRQHIVENSTGINAGMPLIVDNGAKWLQQTMTGVDAQHLETRRHQAEEICSALRVIPLMAGVDTKTQAYASIEQLLIAHVVHTMTPWWTRIEQVVDTQLLTEQDMRDGVYSKFIGQALMRGSTKDRGDYYAKALGAGGAPAWMTQDEVRGLEEMNPMGGLAAQLAAPTNVAQRPSPEGATP